MLLNCHTYYSLCYGTFSTDELLDEVKQKGYSCFVLSDINNTSACIYSVKSAGEMGLKPILGIDFRNGIKQKYVGIARNNFGFKELNEHLTKHLHSGEKVEEDIVRSVADRERSQIIQAVVVARHDDAIDGGSQ